MGRILVPIDPSRMGYQRQRADFFDSTPSSWEGVGQHILVNTAIPLAGKVAGAGAQRYANYRGEQDLAAKKAEHEGMNPALYGRLPQPPLSGRGPTPGSMSIAPEAAPGGERMGAAGMDRSPRAAAAGALSSMAAPASDRTIMGSVQLPREDLFPGGDPNPADEGWFGQTSQPVPGVTGYMRLSPGEGASQTPGFSDPATWSLNRDDAPVGPRTGVPISEAMVDEEGNPIELAGVGRIPTALVRGAKNVNAAANKFQAANPKSARALAAGTIAGIGAGGIAVSNRATQTPSTAPVSAPPPGAATGIDVSLPPSGPSAPPPVVAPPPPDTTGSASATIPGTPGAASTAPGVRRYGTPGGRRVDESAAVAALGDLSPDAEKVDVPPPAAVAAPATAADGRDAAAAYQPPKPRQLVGPGIHDYQTLMNAAAIAQTPEEKQQVLAAAERSGLVDAPSESWLDVINPGARTARGFAQLRGVLGDAGGKTDPLLAIKAENYASQIADRRARENDRRENDAYWAAKTQEQQAVAAQAAAQQEAKTKQMVTDAEAKSRRLAFEIPMLTAKLGQARARMIIAAQDAMDRGEMNDAAMQFKRALAGRNNAETTKIFNMLPHWMRESVAKAAMYDRMPAPSTSVSFGERRQAATEDDLIKGHRRDRHKAAAFEKALSILKTQGDQETMDYILSDPMAFGRLSDDIGKKKLQKEELQKRLEREGPTAKAAVEKWETEIRDRGGTINANGTVTFPPASR